MLQDRRFGVGLSIQRQKTASELSIRDLSGLVVFLAVLAALGPHLPLLQHHRRGLSFTGALRAARGNLTAVTAVRERRPLPDQHMAEDLAARAAGQDRLLGLQFGAVARAAAGQAQAHGRNFTGTYGA